MNMQQLYMLFGGALFLLTSCSPNPPKLTQGVITYRTEISERKAMSISEDLEHPLSIEDIKKFYSSETMLFFNEDVSKWYQSDLSSKFSINEQKGLETYVFHEFRKGEIIEIHRLEGIAVYSYIDDKEKFSFVETSNTLRHLGFECHEVIAIDKAGVPTTRFWVSKAISYPIGPSHYTNQAGAILKVEDLLDDEEVLFEAINFEIASTDKILNSRPQLENMYSKEEFTKRYSIN